MIHIPPPSVIRSASSSMEEPGSVCSRRIHPFNAVWNARMASGCTLRPNRLRPVAKQPSSALRVAAGMVSCRAADISVAARASALSEPLSVANINASAPLMAAVSTARDTVSASGAGMGGDCSAFMGGPRYAGRWP